MGQVTTYTYDANDNVTKVLDRKGQERTYVYNSRNFLLENRASDGTISYTYDAMGRRTGMATLREVLNMPIHPLVNWRASRIQTEPC
ncbi:RHS repeat protein [Paenibacillus sp. PAMC 26794]|uniref:RHS repeat protein n=1 Tax=Paenibacillus sp. PAMC 26794 TaxID=1257080 RepID=UPI0009DB1B18|nr:RHS repeat protein [Paenibacillus sp. PAMC 26794]